MEPKLKIFTVAQTLDWLENGQKTEGLSEQVIAPVRAWAIVHNPYVKPEDAIVAAIYEGEELAAYTAAFPDMIDGNRIWWASTLWCNPKFQGHGYGLIVIGSLMEAHELELTYDRWGAQETVEIFNRLGYSTTYTNRYIFGEKAINRSTLNGKLAYALQEVKKRLRANRYSLPATSYTLKYSIFIDGEAYAFMQKHRGMDLFLWEQKMLNWILQYPFLQGCPLKEKVEKDTMFSSNLYSYKYSVVKVYVQKELIGIYILRNNSGDLSVISLYYEEVQKDIVFVSIAEHYVASKAIHLMIEEKALADYMAEHVYFPSKRTEKISLSTPYPLPVTPYTLQLIDGDSFA